MSNSPPQPPKKAAVVMVSTVETVVSLGDRTTNFLSQLFPVFLACFCFFSRSISFVQPFGRPSSFPSFDNGQLCQIDMDNHQQPAPTPAPPSFSLQHINIRTTAIRAIRSIYVGHDAQCRARLESMTQHTTQSHTFFAQKKCIRFPKQNKDRHVPKSAMDRRLCARRPTLLFFLLWADGYAYACRAVCRGAVHAVSFLFSFLGRGLG
ncbi:hypothetical protein BCV70DRAFT_39443 [Testicularia cyperi]|uniref:Uncharacterized protein n=1 Tax=Testicularia cyperi TaxID=1882483 RepID=A0A317XIC5_9BASI|nr:hypothetical protein BCV70DRAFT_39443 [Testicularia cyperi]